MNRYHIVFGVIGILLISLACGGIGLAYEHDLTGDYAVWAPDLVEQAAIVQKIPGTSSATVIVDSMVVAYGWNDDFIIAKQHPNLDGFDQVDTGLTHWFIVQVATGDVYGPLAEKEYLQYRKEFNIPDDLDFTRTIEPNR
jgi:hypothetical protein